MKPEKYNLTLINTITAVVLCMLSFHVLAQQCDNSRGAMIDPGRFDVNDDGTVTDIETGLTWQRCAMGQQWNGSTCEGEAKLFTWDDAIHSAGPVNHKQGNSKNWRMPKLNELAGIVDIRCKAPRIDLSLFPNTLSQPFWTTNNAPGTQAEAYTLSFGAEGVSRTPKSEKHFVRLVRGRD